MKRILCCILCYSLFFLVSCGNPYTEKEEELKDAVRSNNAEQESIKKSKKQHKEEKIKDINAVINFVNNTRSNEMVDQHGNKLTVLENFEVCYFDFTGEGNDDIAIITWEEDNNYLPVIFVTTDIHENEYYLVNSDFRGNKGDKFFCEESYIIKDDQENQYYDIAYNSSNEFIQVAIRYISYGDIKQILQPEIGIRYEVDNILKKIEGFNRFKLQSIYTYYDETGKDYKYDDITKEYIFNKENIEFNLTETQNMESISLEKLVADHYKVGTNDSLKTFDSVYRDNDLEAAINYYIENRIEFSKLTRVKYVQDYETFIDSFLSQIQNETLSYKDEEVINGVIHSVSIPIKPIPKKVETVFAVVKEFFVQDEFIPTDRIIDSGYYTITCVKSDMTKKINLMQYDKEVLLTGQHSYGANTTNYVDAEFENKETIIEKIKNITYPTILIENLLQIDEFKHKDVWKTTVVIKPQKINYY